MVTILAVLDNFFAHRRGPERDLLRISGLALQELGEEVRRFAREYSPPAPSAPLHPIYLGGWPSANFWESQSGSIAMSSLLYSGQLLAKDPISDWFSLEQYEIPTLMSARPGFVDAATGRLNTARTRRFLAAVVPQLYRFRPLIESNILVLVPSKKFSGCRLNMISGLAHQISNRVGADAKSFCRQFRPHDLAMEDNIRGTIVFTGGEKEKQIRKAIETSAQYFATEYLLASENGFEYTAPFEYEAFLCERGLGQAIVQSTGSNVLRAMFASKLHLFRGLTPEKIATLRDDDNFGTFRSTLFQAYKDIPTRCSQEELDRYIAEAEAAMIEPSLAEIERQTSRGVIGKVGIEAVQAAVRMGAGVLMGMSLLGQEHKAAIAASGASAITAFVASLVKRKPAGPYVIWRTLHDHGRQIAEEVQHAQVANGNVATGREAEFWGIPDTPSMHVNVSSGIIMWDALPGHEEQQSSLTFDGSQSNPYGLCSCRSGQKYKFCCRGLEGAAYPFRSRPVGQ